MRDHLDLRERLGIYLLGVLLLAAGCKAGGCVIPLAQFESLALTLQAQAMVHNDWPRYSSDPPPQMLEALANPKWTGARCR